MNLDKKSFRQVCETIESTARELDINVYESYFHNASEKKILSSLLSYKNDDGGFGHGLEGDFLMPYSSPIATTIAFQYLTSLRENNNAIMFLIKGGIRYFEDTFVSERNGWYAVGREVNDYPHAPWWSYDATKGMCPIDTSWGNPSAEIISYLHLYREHGMRLDVSSLLEHAFSYLQSLKKYESFHEIFCFKRLYDVASQEYRARIKGILSSAIPALVCTKQDKWHLYNAKPLDFINGPDDEYFGIDPQLLNDNLDYVIKKLESDKGIIPNWEWGIYNDEWKRAKEEWTGVLSVKALRKLDAFGRITY